MRWKAIGKVNLLIAVEDFKAGGDNERRSGKIRDYLFNRGGSEG